MLINAAVERVFGSTPNRRQLTAENTTSASRAIVDGETAERDAKTERLRLARLAAEPIAVPSSPKKKTRKRQAA